MNTNLLKYFVDWYQEESSRYEHKQIVINYQGQFHEDFIHGLTDVIEKKLLELKFSYAVAQKAFASISEAVFNIEKYARSQEMQDGSLILYIENKKIHIQVSNIVENIKKDTLIDRLVNTNDLDVDELEERYTELKKRTIISNSAGFGIGLIFIRLCSSIPLNYSFQAINSEYSIFTLAYEI